MNCVWLIRKLESGPVYKMRMVYLKDPNWTTVWLIMCVWLIFFHRNGPIYGFFHMYG